MNKKINKIVKFLEKRPGYLKSSFIMINSKLGNHYTREEVSEAISIVQINHPRKTKAIYVSKESFKVENLEEKLKGVLQKKKNQISLEDLSNILDVSIGKVKVLLLSLEEKGFNIHLNSQGASITGDIPIGNQIVLDVKKHSVNTYKFGLCGDQHLCSKYSREDILNSLYDIYEKEGITEVYNTGNWIDGEARFNKQDIFVHGLDNQIQYMISNYPKRKGITTFYVGGDDHEGWFQQNTGLNIGKYLELKSIEKGRKDLVFLGYMEADVILKAKKGKTIMRILHPGGGSAYAYSYAPQKIVESYTSGEKPHILALGHYHKSSYDYIRGVHTIQTGTTQDQTPFMRKKRLAAHLGGWIIEFSTDDTGAIVRFKQEFIPYYDKPYYDKNWNYKH